MTCPYCGSADVECETVDTGVGEAQCSPYGCLDCQAVQLQTHDDAVTDEERRTLWRRGAPKGPRYKEVVR